MNTPNFLIIGAAKCGTTSLGSLLDLHPEAALARVKEPHFFSVDRNYQRGWEAYLRFFTNRPGIKALGEASTSYSRIREHPNAIQRIKKHIPEAKIIYMVRNPLKRMESSYVEFLCTHGGPTFTSINDAVTQEQWIVDSSRYWETFDAYRQNFGEARIKVVWLEEYAANTVSSFQDVCRFLEIDDSIIPKIELQQRNGRDIALRRMARLGRANIEVDTLWDPQVRQSVIETIRDDNCQFLSHFGRPHSYWGDLF